MWERVLRFRYMITEEAKKRCRTLAFWEKHGNEAVKEAFGVSRRTLFRWQAALRKQGGKLEGLNPVSTAPRKRRKRVVPDGITERVIALRAEHTRLGKDKEHGLLTE